jgi:hypothetical protein
MGSSRRVIALFDAARRRALGFFHGRPFVAYPATGVAALAVCGVLVWLIAFRGGSGAGDVLVRTPRRRREVRRPLQPRGPPLECPPSPNATMQAAARHAERRRNAGRSTAAPPPRDASRSKHRRRCPVTIRSIGDGQIGAPSSRFDVVWYDSRRSPGMGGYPGDGGSAVFSSHVDYTRTMRRSSGTCVSSAAISSVDRRRSGCSLFRAVD